MAPVDQCLRSCAIYLSDGVQYDSRWSPARLEAFDHWTGTTGVLSGQYERKAKTHWKSILHRTFREMPQNNMLFSSLVWFGTQQKIQAMMQVCPFLLAQLPGEPREKLANLPVSKQRGGLCVRKSSRNG